MEEAKEEQSNRLQSVLNEPGRREREVPGRRKHGVWMRGLKGCHGLKENEDE